MNPVEAKTTLETLARGIDPATGELLPEQSPFNNPQVIRALFFAAKEIEKLVEPDPAARAERERPKNAGRAWPPEEDEALLRDFDAGMSPKQLAAKHGRTKGAIDSRLVRLGRVEH
ncbi:hypothetical protein EVC45_29910 [Paraburkholderia sp. UYCP14C]|uniref:hypothetical protein n=1 Tax=Paraburkholderia sp. UYCP14C TaxID=2511130 RepID=UPI00101EA706|nr:hypothetical protein [Paraburkholderia sp. UYCP14C]RZF26069.1 hypothetical protein EVC45_29910 [Paraburkholderia sp. UYCP14C]